MELNQLPALILLMILVGMILGVGILILDKFGTATKESTVASLEDLTISSGVGQTANTNLTAVSFFGNATDLTTQITWTDNGAIAVNVSRVIDGTYNISYTYDADSEASDAMGGVVSAVAPIATTWLGLIVTIAVLALILVLVIRSFAGAGGRK